MSTEQPEKGYRYDPARKEGEVGIDFEPIEYFRTRELAAQTHKYPYEDRFWSGIRFARDLARKRAENEYSEYLQIALLYLFAKSINDLLASVSVAKSGYPLQAWPLLRGGFEAAELMEHLCLHPEDAKKWVDKERKFDQLSWVRNGLPRKEDRRIFHNTVNDITRANLKAIDTFSTLWVGEGETRYIIFGPNPYPITEPNPIALASKIISYPTRILLHSDPGVIDPDWVKKFQQFDAEAKFPFGDAWGAT